MTALACRAAHAAHHDDGHPGCRCGAPETLAAYRRIEADLSRRELIGGVAATLGLFAGFGLGPRELRAQTPPRPLLLVNLRLFDGKALKLRDDVDILIESGRISALPPRGQGPADAERIDCGGHAVIPGLIDCHWHATLVGVTELTALTADIGYVHLVAAHEAGGTLMRGFTTVRDVGGPSFALKRAIDEGVVEGPRIFPSGAMISQTSGHGDFRLLNELPRTPRDPLSYAEEVGVAAIADGPDLVLLRVREQLMRGASQIKMMAGGGVSSLYDPIDAPQYLERELRAGVEAAADWGTYVCVHVYVPEGIKRAIRAGVKCIEHGQLADEETVRMMAGEGVWWSLQPFLMDEDANPKPLPEQRAAQARIADGTLRAYEWAEKHGVKTAFGTDILMNPKGGATHGKQLAKITRFRDPLTALRSATGDAGDLLALSGGRAPYPGALGMIAPGAFADLLVVDGDPSASLDFLIDPGPGLRLIMKDGKVYKNALS
jgi:imidazolonepropionase-like amidohydrolase